MRNLLFAFVLAIASLACTSAASAARPNIVVILTDDQGYADISLNPQHAKEVSTPHMDSLANDGVSFSQGYTSGNVSSATRAGIKIGGYQQRVGVYTAGDGGRGLDPKKKIFPGFLPEAPSKVIDTTGMTPREIERAKIREERRQAKLDAKKAEKKKKNGDKKVAPDSATSRDKVQDNTGTPTPPANDPASRNAEPATSKSVLDLSHWKLTLPTDTAGKYDGHAAEVSAKKLAAGYKDSHFKLTRTVV